MTIESIESSEDYLRFRSNVALKRLVVDDDCNKIWSLYECGPKEVDCPVIFLPPVSGSADIFFRQLSYLAQHGHRVISAEYPSYYTLEEFCYGFRRLLTKQLRVRRVHLFGASLGGFLAQKFAEGDFCRTEEDESMIVSLFLCNSFGDTARFKLVNTVPLFWFAPAPILRNYFVSNDIPADADEQIAAACHFMSNRLQSLSQTELISRLSLNLTDSYVQPERLQSLLITVMDVFDECANSSSTQAELYKLYPNARLAHLESGGNFPYLSRPDEVNLHLMVHLRKFSDTEFCSSIYGLRKKVEVEVHQVEASQEASSNNEETKTSMHLNGTIVGNGELSSEQQGNFERLQSDGDTPTLAAKEEINQKTGKVLENNTNGIKENKEEVSELTR